MIENKKESKIKMFQKIISISFVLIIVTIILISLIIAIVGFINKQNSIETLYQNLVI